MIQIKVPKKNCIILFLICFSYFMDPQLSKKVIYINNNNQILKTNVDYSEISNNGVISSEGNDIFWFIQITDTQFVWLNQKNLEMFNRFLNETNNVINPLFIINTGDIVDADMGRHQNSEEWQKYNETLTANNINSSSYIDLVGNHDGSEDPQYEYFLNYSMTGSEYKTTQVSFNHSFAFGNYAFIGLNTAKDSYSNLLEFAFTGSLNTKELDWYEKELIRYKKYDEIFIFGHHPPFFSPYYKIISNLSSTGKSFFDLNSEFNVKYYFCGHIHQNYIEKREGLTTIITDNFDDNNGTYRIVAVSQNQISTSIENVGKWPKGIIICPTDCNLYDPQYKLESPEIQVLAWDPKGVINVEWCAYLEDGILFKNWSSLNKNANEDSLWEGEISRGLKDNKNYVIKVRITGESAQVIRKIIYSPQKYTNYEIIIMIFISSFIGIVSIFIIIILRSKKLNFAHILRNLSKKNN